MKKVVILTPMDPYKDIRANKVANCLCEENYSVFMIGGFADNNFIVNRKYTVVHYGYKYNIKDKLLRKILWKIKFFIKNYKNIRKINPDIIHACNVDMLLLAKISTIFKKVNLIYDSYEICAYKSGVASEGKIISLVIEMIEKVLIARIKYMICVSNSAMKYFKNKYNVSKIEVITNVPHILNTISDKKVSSSIKKILYLGNFSGHRGIEELILSGNFIDNGIEINLQGFGAFKEDFKKIIEEEELEGKVKFIDPILPSEVINEISCKADIGVVLTKPTSINHQLTISNKIFDYINAGLPIIMSNVEEHRYINNKYNVGIIIDNVTPEEIAKAINILSKDEKLHKSLSNNCLIAARKLNWNIEKEKLIRIYSELER